jgi:hypothetical protein
MHPGSCVQCQCSAPSVILSRPHHSCRNGGLSGLHSVRETDKSRVGEGLQLGCFFGKKNSLVEKGSVRRCIVMMGQPILLSPKFGVKCSHIFRQSP